MADRDPVEPAMIPYLYQRVSDGNQDDYVKYGIALQPGTWRFLVLGTSGPDGGIADFTLACSDTTSGEGDPVPVDKGSIGTVDFYSASAGALFDISGVTVTIEYEEVGWYVLTMTMSDKHASSSAYFARFQRIWPVQVLTPDHEPVYSQDYFSHEFVIDPATVFLDEVGFSSAVFVDLAESNDIPWPRAHDFELLMSCEIWVF